MNIERRAFLKSAAAAAVGFPTLSNAASERRLKIGFLGLGHSHGPGKVQVVRASPEWELVGVCEPDAQVRAANPHVEFISQEELFSRAEVIAVESAVRDHARDAKLALEAGKHVHLEKPPAAKQPEFAQLAAIARDRARLIQCGYMWRYNPGLVAAMHAATNGWLGHVHLVSCAMNTSLDPRRRAEWGEFKGGAMFELGAHLIDVVVRLLGRPVTVTAFLKSHDPAGDGFADNTAAVLTYERAMAIVCVSTMQPNAGAHRFFEITGSHGTARVQPIEQPVLQVDLSKAAGPYSAGSQTVKFPRYDRYVDDFRVLALAVRGEQPLAVSLETEGLVQEVLLKVCGM